MMTTIKWTYQYYIKIIRLNQKIRDLYSKVRWGWLLSHAGNSNETTACRREVLFIGKTDMENPNGERAMPKESQRMVVVLSGFLVLGPWKSPNEYKKISIGVCVCQGSISNPQNIHQPAVFESAQLEHSTLMDISRFWCWKWSKLMKAWHSRQNSL